MVRKSCPCCGRESFSARARVVDVTTAAGVASAVSQVLAVRGAAVRAWAGASERDMGWLNAIVEAADALAFKLRLWQKLLVGDRPDANVASTGRPAL